MCTRSKSMNKQIRVRLRHVWVTLMAFPLTEEQSAKLAAGDRSDFRAAGPLDMEFTSPVCQRCQLDYTDAPYSCPGEPTSFASDGGPLFSR
jgi:hypothetical protein